MIVETRQEVHKFLLSCLLTPLEDKIEQQRRAAASEGWVHPNLAAYPAVRESFVSTFEVIRAKALQLMQEEKYEEAESVIATLWPQLSAIAGDIHPEGCLETDGAGQWIAPFCCPFPQNFK